MGPETVVAEWWGALAAGVVLSLLLEQLLLPAVPRWQRPAAAWLLHLALWLTYQSFFAGSLGRPWLGLALALVGLMTLVVVSNAKYRSLREPFTVHDFEYFTDAMRHPRLYLPFLRASPAVVLACVSVLAGLWACFVREPNLYGIHSLQNLLLAGVPPLLLSGALLFLAMRHQPALRFSAKHDLARLGLLPSLWHYAREWRRPVDLASPLNHAPSIRGKQNALPNLVVVQSESFFDPRGLFDGIRSDVLREFDAVRQAAVCRGRLEVPAWGANTIRTEFSFLFGLSPEAQGVHQFQPYRKLAHSGLPQLVGLLRDAGYRTVCIHPYPASFYGRDALFPKLGFDEFLDIHAFSSAERVGPYIGDAAVGARIKALLDAQGEQPLFIFAITMENHGPLQLERASKVEHPLFYTRSPPSGCGDLTVYLRHLRNADAMIGEVSRGLSQANRPGYLCWYGDHVPIMPRTYAELGEPDARTDYFLWHSEGGVAPIGSEDIPVHALGLRLLEDLAARTAQSSASI